MTLGRAASTIIAIGLAALLVGTLAGCAGGNSITQPPSAAPSPVASVSAALDVSAAQIGAALRTAGILSAPSPVAYRPAESPRLAGAQRLVVKADLIGDEGQGFIVIYDFPDAGRAYDAGAEMADYLASGPGRVQFRNDARFVMRQVGSTLVFYSWTPSGAPEPGAAAVATALDGLGVPIPIAR